MLARVHQPREHGVVAPRNVSYLDVVVLDDDCALVEFVLRFAQKPQFLPLFQLVAEVPLFVRILHSGYITVEQKHVALGVKFCQPLAQSGDRVLGPSYFGYLIIAPIFARSFQFVEQPRCLFFVFGDVFTGKKIGAILPAASLSAAPTKHRRTACDSAQPSLCLSYRIVPSLSPRSYYNTGDAPSKVHRLRRKIFRLN